MLERGIGFIFKKSSTVDLKESEVKTTPVDQITATYHYAGNTINNVGIVGVPLMLKSTLLQTLYHTQKDAILFQDSL